MVETKFKLVRLPAKNGKTINTFWLFTLVINPYFYVSLYLFASMITIKKIRQFFYKKAIEVGAAGGYNIWAEKYDDQPDNLMLALDELIFTNLLEEIELKDKVVADIGCGTGRHWQKLFTRQPAQLTGYDVSAGMLNKLQQKFPQAQTHILKNDELKEMATAGCDIIISTLTVAHIHNLPAALAEWNMVLKPGGYILITDYHPAILQKGGLRTFEHEGKTVAVKNYVHSLEKIKAIAGQLHWELLRLKERIIDDEVKPFYEKQNALPVFEAYKGMPVIYGMLFKKR